MQCPCTVCALKLQLWIGIHPEGVVPLLWRGHQKDSTNEDDTRLFSKERSATWDASLLMTRYFTIFMATWVVAWGIYGLTKQQHLVVKNLTKINKKGNQGFCIFKLLHSFGHENSNVWKVVIFCAKILKKSHFRGFSFTAPVNRLFWTILTLL